MKTKPVPTSPKLRKKENVVDEIYKQDIQKSFDKPPVRHHNGILILVLATLAGFLAGILGETIINALSVSYPNLPVISSLYVSTYPTDSSIILQKNGKTIEAQEFEILETLDQIQSAVVTVFEKKNAVLDDVLDQNYQSGEALGNALILTDDGLLVTINQVLSNPQKEYVVLTSEKKIFTAEKIIQDSATDLVFFRIDASNLSVAEFIDPVELRMGQKLLTLANKTNGMYESDSSTIRDLLYYQDEKVSDIVYSSEKLSDSILINKSLPDGFLGSPLVTTNGKIVGIAIANELNELNQILPGGYVQQTIPKILQDNTVNRTFFGVTYIDLSRTTQLDSEIVGSNSVGALLYDNASLSVSAVEVGSPAEVMGLEANDIITSINGKEISKTENLSVIIQSFDPEEQVDVEYLRDGERKTAKTLLSGVE
ncbi:S1C family serine protease [Patescibacteria group bacterium]|nr:S1C family serine protease [Patescibacteria group bacterium]